jgi:hypothetical protein
MSRGEILPLQEYAIGRHESAVRDVEADAVELSTVITRDGWPATSLGVLEVTQFITRDNGQTWIPAGGATFSGSHNHYATGLPVLECRIGTRSRNPVTKELIPFGAGVRMKTEIRPLIRLTLKAEAVTRVPAGGGGGGRRD